MHRSVNRGEIEVSASLLISFSTRFRFQRQGGLGMGLTICKRIITVRNEIIRAEGKSRARNNVSVFPADHGFVVCRFNVPHQ